MADPWLALFLCTGAVAGNVVAHLLSYRATRRYMLSIFAAFFVGVALLMAGELWRFSVGPRDWLETAFLLAGDLAIYGCGAFVLFNFINAGESSIRIRILRELRLAGEPLSEAALLDRYNDRIILETRLGRMVSNRQVEHLGERYRLLSPTLARPAKVFRRLKQLLLRRTSEFDGVD